MLTNVALHKQACQSSSTYWSKPGESAAAVNGHKTGGFSFHTKHQDGAWWQVDLGCTYPLHSIVVYNYGPASSETARRASRMAVLLSADGLSWKHHYTCREPFGGLQDNAPLVVTCDDLPARFVRLQLLNSNYFHLDQVEVYADEYGCTTYSLAQLGARYGTDKVTHGFCGLYEEQFGRLQPTMTKLLEIGGGFGASLRMWRDWLPNAVIHGADHFTGQQGNGSSFADADRFLREVQEGQHKGIVLHQLDQSGREELSRFVSRHQQGSFDIIIDDASHLIRDQQQTLPMLFCLVRPGGYFVIEDLHISFGQDYDLLPDQSNSTLMMIEQGLAGNGWRSCYLSEREAQFLDNQIDRNESRILTSGNSITCILRRKALAQPPSPPQVQPGTVALVNYATFDVKNQLRQQQHIRWADQWGRTALHDPASGISSFSIAAFHPDCLDAPFREHNAALLAQERGGGYWLWKPYVIAAMLAASSAEYIVYCDSGSTLQVPLQTVVATMRETGAKLLAFRMAASDRLERQWSKGRVLRALDAATSDILDSGQICGGVSIWKNCAEMRELTGLWLELAQQAELVDDSPSSDGLGEYEGFREHRHDQSLFSVLLKKLMQQHTTPVPSVVLRDFETWVGHHTIDMVQF